MKDEQQLVEEIARAILTADERDHDLLSISGCPEEVASYLATAALSILKPKIEAMEEENARLSKAVCSGVLGELLTADENDALVAFIRTLRNAAALNGGPTNAE